MYPASRIVSRHFLTVGPTEVTATGATATTLDTPFPDNYTNSHCKDESAESTQCYKKYIHVLSLAFG